MTNTSAKLLKAEQTRIEMMLRMAQVASKSSKDPKTKVGAVISTPDYRQISYSWNGFPSSVPDLEALWLDKEQKHKYVIHTEVNAIMNCNFDTKGAYLFCTHKPCHKCLAQILQAGITRVVYMVDHNKRCTDSDTVNILARHLDTFKQHKVVNVCE